MKGSYKVVESYVEEWSSEPEQVKVHFDKMAEKYVRILGHVQWVHQALLILIRVVLVGLPFSVVITFMVTSESSSGAFRIFTALQLGLVITAMLISPCLPGNGSTFSSTIRVLYLIGISSSGYFLLVDSGVSAFPVVADIQEIDALALLVMLFTYASIATLATVAIVAFLYRVRRKTNAWLMRSCPREELIFLSIEVAQNVDQEHDRIKNDGWSREIVEKLTRISRLLETCAFLPTRDMDRKAMRVSTERFAPIAQSFASLRMQVWLPYMTSSQEIRAEAARLAALILLRYYGELFPGEAGDTIKRKLGVVVLRLIRTLVVAVIPIVIILATLLVSRAFGFELNKDLVTPFMLVAASWVAFILLRDLDYSVGQQFGRVIGLFSQLWSGHKGPGEEEKEKEKGDKYEEGKGGHGR